MRVKYLQEWADMADWYEGIIRNIANVHSKRKLSDFHYTPSEGEQGVLTEIQEELDAVKYMVNLRYGYSEEYEELCMYGNDKPKVEVMLRALEKYNKRTDKLYNMSIELFAHKELLTKNYKKRKKFLRHYMFQFSLQGWYERLPVRLPTYEEKFGMLKK